MSRLVKKGALCSFILTILAVPAFAGNDARDYIPLPPGTTLMASYFNHISATDFYVNGEKVSRDMNLGANIGVIRPVYYTQIGSLVIDPQAIIPFGTQSLNIGGTQEIQSSGLADPILAATLWFVNNPESKTWVGFTPFVTLPIGEYDKNKGVNLGNNRFAFKGEFGYVKGFSNYILDLTANAEMYTDNDKYTSANLTLEQDPVFGMEAHLSRNINPSFYVGIDYYYRNGGETSVSGVNNDDAKDDHTVGLTLGFMLSPSYQLLVKYQEDLAIENGLKTNTLGTRIAYFF